jgi:hypothetical protein
MAGTYHDKPGPRAVQVELGRGVMAECRVFEQTGSGLGGQKNYADAEISPAAEAKIRAALETLKLPAEKASGK